MRFSVIIPLYNKAPYVAKAIGSVLSQTYSDYEVVVMDDGSYDDSFAVALEAIKGHSNSRLYRQNNQGVSMARNNAVDLSHGQFLCFLDADDWWEPTFLEEMDKFMSEFPDAGIYGSNYIIINETRRKTRVASVGVDEGFEKGYINYCQVYAKTMYMPLWTGAVCIPRSVFAEMHGFPQGIKLGEDFLLWIRIALKYKAAFLNKPLAYYNQDIEGANRGVGKLYQPQEHMLWNLDFLEEEEKIDFDYKQLVDNLRTFCLMPYLVSKEYCSDAQRELDKVDWNRQPVEVRERYHKPIIWLRTEMWLRGIGSRLKQLL